MAHFEERERINMIIKFADIHNNYFKFMCLAMSTWSQNHMGTFAKSNNYSMWLI